MKATTAPIIGYGSIRADEILPLREAARRLGWEQKTIRRAQREGLRAIPFGRLKYVRGADVLEFFGKLADAGQGGHADG
jgi:hypothetical protein